MLIEQSDQRQLTEMLMEDAALWSADALASASGGVAYDPERTAHLLAAWAQVNAAGTNHSVPLFAKHPEANEPWAKLGAELAATADQGAVGLLEKAVRRCAAELGPDGRAKLLAQLATGVSPLIRLGGRRHLDRGRADRERPERQFNPVALSLWPSARVRRAIESPTA